MTGIAPTEADIGRPVLYIYRSGEKERGILQRIDGEFVLVRYDNFPRWPMISNPHDLEWEFPGVGEE